MNVANLKKYARIKGVDISNCETRMDMIRALAPELFAPPQEEQSAAGPTTMMMGGGGDDDDDDRAMEELPDDDDDAPDSPWAWGPSSATPLGRVCYGRSRSSASRTRSMPSSCSRDSP